MQTKDTLYEEYILGTYFILFPISFKQSKK